MLKLFFVITMFGCFVLLCAALLFTLFRKELAISRRISTYIPYSDGGKQSYRPKRPQLQGVTRFTDQLKQWVDKRTSKKTKQTLEKKLQEAGRPFRLTAIEYRLLQLILAVGFFILPHLLVSEGNVFLMSISLGVLAGYLPSFLLSVLRTRRLAAIERSIPDFFDMLTLSIQAGLGLDASIQKVCKHFGGPISDEFQHTLEDIKLGRTRKDAFLALKERVPSQWFQNIINSIVHAEMLGVGMSNTIRALTERMREQRKQRAREKAMKAPIKMIFPMLFLIFPSIFIIILGPLVIMYLTKF